MPRAELQPGRHTHRTVFGNIVEAQATKAGNSTKVTVHTRDRHGVMKAPRYSTFYRGGMDLDNAARHATTVRGRVGSFFDGKIE